MNMRFRNYVTDVAFRLTLGKTHITALAAVREGGEAWPSRAQAMGLWIGAIHGLIHRGLVIALPIWDTPDGRPPMEASGAEWERSFNKENARRPFNERYRLSEEGELCWKLLVLSGLVEDIKPKRATRSKAANAA